jgi:hypothetical protein
MNGYASFNEVFFTDAKVEPENTWRVAVPMTSNLKAVRNGQHSSPIPWFWSEKSDAEVTQRY